MKARDTDTLLLLIAVIVLVDIVGKQEEGPGGFERR
jgi:hypothetical protein